MIAMSIPVPGGSPDDADFVYDEFAYFSENCEEFGLEWNGSVRVERVEQRLADGRTVSALRWGDGPIELVLLHGGAQNAHTWDTVALALRPTGVLAIDLTGHGRSSWRDDGAYGPEENADDAAALIDRIVPDAAVVVGMSFGGLTANALAAKYPWLVRRLVIVDVTPGVNRDKAAEVHAFIEGPQTFGSFAEIFDRTVEFNPTRSPESLRRGILHNAHRLPSGEWEWNYDRSKMTNLGPDEAEQATEAAAAEYSAARWQDVEDVRAPYLLLRGALSPVVDDDDVAELLRRQPEARVTVVDGAGHSIQGDRPIELAEILRAELAAG
jgi:pimeloyl-ACP methyl ester carboxylesterase